MNYFIIIISGMGFLFSISNVIYNILKYKTPNINKKDKKNLIKKIYMYGFLVIIFFTINMIINPGPTHLK